MCDSFHVLLNKRKILSRTRCALPPRHKWGFCSIFSCRGSSLMWVFVYTDMQGEPRKGSTMCAYGTSVCKHVCNHRRQITRTRKTHPIWVEKFVCVCFCVYTTTAIPYTNRNHYTSIWCLLKRTAQDFSNHNKVWHPMFWALFMLGLKINLPSLILCVGDIDTESFTFNNCCSTQH